MAEIVQLLASPVARYVGRPADWTTDIGDASAGDLVDRITVRVRLGIVGDRYFNQLAHRDASLTVIAAESLTDFAGVDLRQVRRNVLLRGVDVDAHRGDVLTLDSGDGAVRLLLRRPANPCAWMDAAIGPGAFRALRGHGGMRCVPLDDGVLRVGPVEVGWSAYEGAALGRR